LDGARARAGADSLHDSLSRNKNATDSSATTSLGPEGAVAFVDVLTREIVGNLEGLFPTTIAKIAGGFQDLTAHFSGRLVRKIPSSFHQTSARTFLRNGQIQNLNYLSRNVDVGGRQFVFKTNLEIRARRDERIVNIERT